MHFVLSQIIPEVLVNAPVSLTSTQFDLKIDVSYDH